MGAGGGEEMVLWERAEESLEVASESGGGGKMEKIVVSVRLRPLSEKEVAENDPSDWECINDTTIIFRDSLLERSINPTAYTFATVFAYGQTCSGKTYTMTGITEYTAQDIYEYIHKHEERAFVLKFSAIEIYNEAVKDLLSTDSAPLRLLDDPETIESSAREFLGKDNSSILVASVNFVDLGGSERASQALSAGTRLKEGCHINRSLLTLGTVIRKLSKGRNGHIPYRDSKLTRILQPSLGGNARTAIICTMSPARSHIEQSRNTLLFASCAKEVATNAQLQKEVARLESELRYPGISPRVEALLREKDAQIKKMENEIEELIKQRDLGQSRLEGLLEVVGKDHFSNQWDDLSQTSVLNLPHSCDDLLLMSEPFDIADHSLDFASTQFVTSHNQHYLQTHNQDALSPRHSVANLKFNGSTEDQGEEEIEQFEENCEEVICIEINGTCRSEDSSSLLTEGRNSLQHLSTVSSGHIDGNHKAGERRDLGSPSADPITLEQHLHNVRKTLISLVKAYPDESSPLSSWQDSSFRSFPLGRSRSCRSTLMSSSSWLQEDSTPPSTSLKEFPGRPEGFQNKLFSSNFGAKIKKLSARVFQNSEDSKSFDAQRQTTSRSDDYVEPEMAQVHHQKQFFIDQFEIATARKRHALQGDAEEFVCCRKREPVHKVGNCIELKTEKTPACSAPVV
ncbi:hypothetical protein C4D60_Mb02t12910 [Musa balbisiana]|uniref:Kinesin motor domain-containing protein n=1 Tax=Musa balbisiana TaxID=52838 RepID=A0A4S8IBM4_MUSBA|nr:hypothetical protein C4D60_Mb02t12910 [Musa balbisiana]